MKRLAYIALASVFALLSAASPAHAQSRAFRVIDGSRIQFVSDAPLERITGVSSSVSGELQVDPASLAGARGRVAVRVGSIRTGIDLRDEHLRGPDWLDAGQFPEASFEITGIDGVGALAAGQIARLTIHGRFSLHGVTREVSASAQVRLTPASDALRAHGITGDLLRAQASFEIQLADYQVSISAPVRLKVSNTIRVNVTIRAAAG